MDKECYLCKGEGYVYSKVTGMQFKCDNCNGIGYVEVLDDLPIDKR
jgi:DnaJ-class molecular chaperone